MTSYPSPTIQAITDFLFIEEDPAEIQPCELVLVLGNDYIDGTMEVVRGLYDSGKIRKDAKIILSGATGTLNAGKEPECDRLFTSGTEKFNMPPEVFIKERRASNAAENFSFSKEIILEMGGFDSFESIMCIGKAFLLRRASMYAAKYDYPAGKMHYIGTVDKEGRNIGKNCWWENPTAVERVLAEVRRIGEYGGKGDLSIF